MNLKHLGYEQLSSYRLMVNDLMNATEDERQKEVMHEMWDELSAECLRKAGTKPPAPVSKTETVGVPKRVPPLAKRLRNISKKT